MRKLILLLCMVCLLPSLVEARGSLRKSKPGNESIQGFATHGVYVSVLGVGSTIIDMTDDTAWSLYTTGSGCFVRSMPLSTSAKGSYVKWPVPSDTWHTEVAHEATPFMNFSGCPGYLRRMR